MGLTEEHRMLKSPYVSYCSGCVKSVELLCDTLKKIKNYYCIHCRQLVRSVKRESEE